ncbi:ubiquitin-associated domain-containing protein 2-like [Tropilaelaps mercedesae]|uniref:Ubiquitin-associated domain-containing protein 2-like n=1 Tax=Tropilaelaps mercedesae TaxID=418985 RepID=A0A1V9X5F4_9ACAR|nr:ubiquitin-associated domain-containing protein 2-like [Tropilaelaps mercedesae]
MQAHGCPENGPLFENTPVSFALLTSLGVLRAATLLPIDIELLEYNIDSILSGGQVWRILTSKLCFLESRDLLSCAILLFYFRGVERRLGTGRFANLILGHFMLTCAVEWTMMHLLSTWLPDYLPTVVPSGPFFAVYPLLQWFISEFPPVSRSSSQHSAAAASSSDSPLVTPLLVITIVAIDLVFAPPRAYFAIGCAMLAGALLKENFLCLNCVIRLPRRLFPWRSCEVSTRKIGATLEVQRSMHAEFLDQQMIYNSTIFAQQHRQGLSGGLMQRNIVAPPEELVTQLTEMGFARENAVEALQTTNNNLQMATNILLSQ